MAVCVAIAVESLATELIDEDEALGTDEVELLDSETVTMTWLE